MRSRIVADMSSGYKAYLIYMYESRDYVGKSINPNFCEDLVIGIEQNYGSIIVRERGIFSRFRDHRDVGIKKLRDRDIPFKNEVNRNIKCGLKIGRTFL